MRVLGASVGGGRYVPSLIGAEVTSGELETWLGGGLTLRDIVLAVFGLVSTAPLAIWAVITAIVVAGLLWLRGAPDPTTSLPASCWPLLLAAPPALCWPGIAFATDLAFAGPRLRQPAERGIMHGTGNAVGSAAALPGIAVMIVVLVGAQQGPSAPLLVTVSAAVITVLFAAGVVPALRGASPEGLISSL